MSIIRAGRSTPKRIDWATRRARAKKKFIPDADRDFAWMAKLFVDQLERHASHFGIPDEQRGPLADAVQTFRDKLAIHAQP